jgi:Glycosyltransferase family 87
VTAVVAAAAPPRVRPQWMDAVLVVALGGLVASTVGAFAAGIPNDARWTLVGWYAGMWAAFAVAVVALLRGRCRGRAAVALVLGGGIVLQVAALAFPPRSTDDYYRYAWDGAVQSAGVDPYRYVPIDPALADLRTDWLFPPGCRRLVDPCTRLNHPGVRTIYPPVAQAEFTAVHLLAPRSADKPWQLTAALLAVLTTAALLTALRRAGRDPRWAALWAWCPSVAIEAGNAAHVDVAGALLLVLALTVLATATRRRALLAAGALLGAAIGVKLLPGLALPATLRDHPRSARPPGTAAAGRGRFGTLAARRGVLVPLAAVAVVALSYLPHVLAVGPEVLGYLPGYLREEGYDGTGRFPVIRVLGAPPHAAPYLAAAVLAAVAAAVARRTDPARPADGAVVMVATGLLVLGPSYPWYALLVVALVAMSGRWEWLPVAAAGYPPYLVGALHTPPEPTKMVAYGTAAVLTAALFVLRIRRSPGPDRGFTDRSARARG